MRLVVKQLLPHQRTESVEQLEMLNMIVVVEYEPAHVFPTVKEPRRSLHPVVTWEHKHVVLGPRSVRAQHNLVARGQHRLLHLVAEAQATHNGLVHAEGDDEPVPRAFFNDKGRCAHVLHAPQCVQIVHNILPPVLELHLELLHHHAPRIRRVYSQKRPPNTQYDSSPAANTAEVADLLDLHGLQPPGAAPCTSSDSRPLRL
ncbi:hypothetical protein ON010_g10625 [Phytophthora cinnamomi]|nr:hypothetical protein ON010_g10625 [Phytophthora cinnamomi]